MIFSKYHTVEISLVMIEKLIFSKYMVNFDFQTCQLMAGLAAVVTVGAYMGKRQNKTFFFSLTIVYHCIFVLLSFLFVEIVLELEYMIVVLAS